jgi:hypothetical protein
VSAQIDFDEINRRALAQLPELLRVWLPGGKQHGAEYVVCNPKRHDLTPGSFKINTQTGKWGDFIPGGAYGSDTVSLYAFLHDLSDDKKGQCEAARQLGQRVGVEVANGHHYDLHTGGKPVPTGLPDVSGEPKPTPIIPVPEDATPCKWRHPQYGDPVAKWAYYNADGALIGFAARVEYTENGERKKDVFPVTWCRIDHATGHYHAWRARGIPAPRPLYNLWQLLASPDAPVVVTEGEKKADRVPELFPGHVGVTSMGGSKAPDKSDWSPLAGRNAVTWPDHDIEGEAYVQAVAALATAAGAAAVRIVEIPDDWPVKWDLADPLPEGYANDALISLLQSAPLWTAPPAENHLAAEPGKTVRNLPIVKIGGGRLSAALDEAEAILIKRDENLFQRGDFIVRPAPAAILIADRKKTTGIRLVRIRTAHMVERLTKWVDFQKYDARSKKFVSVDCPANIAAAYLERKGMWNLPALAGLTNCPTLRPDGSVLDQPGYDESTGILYDPRGVKFPEIPKRPTRDDAVAAIYDLKALIRDFPFVDDADRSVAISGVLTALIRRSIPHAPLHSFSAPVAGSGKSKLVDVASMHANGHRAPVVSPGSTPEEMEKQLGSMLIAGDRLISFDNCEKPLGGPLLCQCLTQPFVKPRLLGKSENPDVPSDAVYFATGQNLILLGDLVRRALRSVIDPETDEPEKRTFETEDPVKVLGRERPRYVIAALTILRAFDVAGRPQSGTPLGSFEEWWQWVRGALVWLDQADPCLTMETIRRDDPRLNALIAMITHWQAALGTDSFTVQQIISRATDTLPQQRTDFNNVPRVQYHWPEFRETLLEVAGKGGSVNGYKLGTWLRSNKGRIVNGLRIENGIQQQTWRVGKPT